MRNNLAHLSSRTAAGIDISPRLAGRIAGWGILAMVLIAASLLRVRRCRYAHEADVVGDEPAGVLIFTPGATPVGMGEDRND